MKKAYKLREILSRIRVKKKRIKALDIEKINENGKIDFDISIEIQRIESDIYQLRRQVAFLKKGESHLGTPFTDTNINEYI